MGGGGGARRRMSRQRWVPPYPVALRRQREGEIADPTLHRGGEAGRRRSGGNREKSEKKIDLILIDQKGNLNCIL